MGGYIQRVRIEGVVLGLSEQKGALVVYCKKDKRGERIKIYQKLENSRYGPDLYASVVERTVNGASVFAAIFPSLQNGEYTLSCKGKLDWITVFPGEVAEVDWR